MVEAEAILAAEGIIAIALSLGIIALGVTRWAIIRSEEARLKFVENWSSFRLALFLFGGSLFIYLLAEASETAVLSLSGLREHELHLRLEIIHMFMLILALGISMRFTMRTLTGGK